MGRGDHNTSQQRQRQHEHQHQHQHQPEEQEKSCREDMILTPLGLWRLPVDPHLQHPPPSSNLLHPFQLKRQQ